VAAERSRAADGDVPQRPTLHGAERVGPPVRLLVTTEKRPDVTSRPGPPLRSCHVQLEAPRALPTLGRPKAGGFRGNAGCVDQWYRTGATTARDVSRGNVVPHLCCRASGLVQQAVAAAEGLLPSVGRSFAAECQFSQPLARMIARP
jgi:hypothetical protein